ncbi:EamA family transporter [Nesterenkonia natronophila]|uniref:EamA family transporter n=1 Tax=Nesterenkonia natronophila TaxID=2174932 RepID=A0A3A4F3V2_9MICC|nr:EamA family transporter [Nesterenkonia natronophila]RJN32743.1 EamA family transporter [Nesterenkonia natronophila]
MSSWIQGHPGRGFSLIATSALSTQTGAAVGSFAFGTLGPLGVVAIRQMAAAIVLCSVARPKLRQFTAAQWKPVALLAFFFAVMNAALYTALDRVGLGTAVTIEFLGPLAVAAWSSRRRRDLLGVVLALLGVIMLTRPSPTTDFLGIAVALIAAVCWAGYILTNREVGKRVPGVQGTAAATILSSLGMLPVLILIIWQVQPPWQAYLFACAAGLLSTAIPYALDLVVLRYVSPLIFGVGMSLHPLFAGIIGLVLLSEQLPLIAWSGIVLVVLSNGLTLTGPRSAVGAAPRLQFRKERRTSPQPGAQSR